MQRVVNQVSDFEDCILCNEDCYDTTKRLTNGSIDLIYLDPPFFTGRSFEINNCKFDDRWSGLDNYLSWLELRLREFKRILSRTGSIYIHCDWHTSHNIKVLADKIFKRENFLNEIIWKRQSAHNDASQGSRHFGRIHDTILVYTGSSKYVWNQLYLPYDDKYVKSAYRYVDPNSNRRYALGDLTGPGGGVKGNPKYEFLVHLEFVSTSLIFRASK